MHLILEIVNHPALDNGAPTKLPLHRHGAVIGRSAKSDWVLPDPRKYISSRHCEIAFKDEDYVVTDTSTNGTQINGTPLNGSRALADGDMLTVGHYEIHVAIMPGAVTKQGYAAEPGGSAWENAPAWWSGTASGEGPLPEPAAAADQPPNDLWDKLAQANRVDWARGLFGGRETPATPDSSPVIDQMLHAAGLERAQIKASDTELAEAAGDLLRRMIGGMVVMLEARARAKDQMGAQTTGLEFDGNNPLKFARTPEQALAQLLNPSERGFMAADVAVEDAFHDLQAHQLATLKAMQGALRSTLDRFSPSALRSRVPPAGLAKLLLMARDAALWQAYEKDYGGATSGFDDAFIELFATEFRKAYEGQTSRRRKR